MIITIGINVIFIIDRTPLVYSESKNMFNPSDVTTITTTVQDHDLEKVKEAFTQTLMSLGIMALLHLKFGFVRPLLLQSILGIKTLASTPLFRIYVLGQPAVGDLARPWKKSPFE